MSNFLFEIGCEEIPARMIDNASAELSRRVRELLIHERLADAVSLQEFSTPRRLAVIVSGVSQAQPDIEEQVMGPSLKVAYKDGRPAAPAVAFAGKVGLDLSKLEKVTTPKGDYLAAKIIRKGRPASEVLAELLPREIGAIYWPKNMYWRNTGERFVRPVRWLIAMLDDRVVPLAFAGIHASSKSRGHRILADRTVEITAALKFAETLCSVKVLDQSARGERIRKELDAAARSLSGARWREDKTLLDSVVNLTEFPSAILGNFDREFLELPEEVLVTVMRDHQKYFAVEDASGKLAPHFLAVLNTDGDPQGIIRHGHERVLRARFNDARFFWQTDQKVPLRERVELLKHVTFQKDLGSYYDKTLRVQRLCSWLSEIVRQSGMQIRPGVVHKAACLAKADLTTELVKEFTELQGIVGGLYARAQQLDPDLPENTRFAIADAIYDHYKPQSMQDSVPRTIEGAVLSVGDKADSIAGMFALGLQPTGSKDPFALRRQANGIVKIVAEWKLPLTITEIFKSTRAGYPGSDSEKTKTLTLLYSFMRERQEFYLREAKGFDYDTVRAVMASSADPDNIVETIARAEAVAAVRGSEDFKQISIAFKRIKNILSQVRDAGVDIGTDFDLPVMQEKEEKILAKETRRVSSQVEQLQKEGRYIDALTEISKLRPAVDSFFDKVMVMVEDAGLRKTRLALLAVLLKNFSTIADFSEIVTEGKESKESTKQ
ncbi:MAG: glycine--tRNA ligase subunit beta [Acidobacteria bacterium]|nr:MAG: glycine--tRNA ligase subunit beta [Acidobacteriota bacterium]